MAGADVVVLTDANWETEVLKSSLPVLVDFWATWCGPCQALAPTIDELATAYKGRVKVGKYDVDANEKYAEQHGIRSIPTLILFKQGAAVDTVVGALAKARLVERLDQALA